MIKKLKNQDTEQKVAERAPSEIHGEELWKLNSNWKETARQRDIYRQPTGARKAENDNGDFKSINYAQTKFKKAMLPQKKNRIHQCF